MMNKEDVLKYIDEALADLQDEQEYNENLSKKEHTNWVSKDKAKLTDIMDNWWGYEVLILQLETIKKRIINEQFDYSWNKRIKE